MRRKHLFNLLVFYKMYPNNRLLFLILDTRSQKERVILTRMRQTEAYLASRMDEVDTAWAARNGDHNRLPHMFDEHVTGSLDTFPVYVSRPKDSWWQTKLYNGKYGTCHAFFRSTRISASHAYPLPSFLRSGGHVVKFQLACDHQGVPFFWTGPHIGTVHDMRLWELNPAPLARRERLLADKAYNKKGNMSMHWFQSKSGLVQVIQN
jgi:hypothetical protein